MPDKLDEMKSLFTSIRGGDFNKIEALELK